MTRRFPLWLVGLLLVGAVVLAYWPSFSAPFIFDDRFAIVENPSLRHLSHLWQILLPPTYAAGATGRPIVNLSLALNYAAGGLHPVGYHLVNLLLHLGTALTLWALVRRTLALVPSLAVSAAAITALWALHPLLTQSVSTVIQRSEILASLFCLLTLYAFVCGRLALAVLFCLLAMLSKEMAAALPLLVVLYDRTFLKTSWRQRRVYYLGLAATWLPLAALVMTTGRRFNTVGFGLGVSPWVYLLTQCRALVLYLKLAVWPHPLAIDYGTDFVRHAGEVLPQALFLLVLLAATVIAVGKSRPLGFLGAAFFALLAPSSSFVPIVTEPIAEQRMYLPLAILIILVVLAAYRVFGRHRLVLWVPLVGLLLLAVTFGRNRDYRSEELLTRGSLLANPRNDRAYLNLGTFASRDGRLAEAIDDYVRAIGLNPNESDTHFNLGVVLARTGRSDEAMAQYREAIRLNPAYPAAWHELGLALAADHHFDEALPPLRRAAELQPDSSKARSDLAAIEFDVGTVEAKAGRYEQARAHYLEVLRLRPNDEQTRRNLTRIDQIEGR